MKRFSIELKVTILMLVTMVSIFATGYLAYRSLSYIVTSIDKEVRPDLKLEILKNISTDLADVEGSIKYYLLTRDSKYLRPYYNIISSIDSKIENLTVLAGNDSAQLAQIEIITELLDEKLWVWDQMLSMQKDDRVDEALDQISSMLQDHSDSIAKVDSSKQLVEVEDTSIDDTVSIPEEVEEEKTSIWQRFFSRKKKKQEDEDKKDMVDEKLKVVQSVKIDTVTQASSDLELDKELIESEIVKIKEANEEFVKKLTAKELMILQKNEIIGRELSAMITRMEKDELIALTHRIKEADILAESTKKWLGLFCILATLLLVGILLVIVRFVHRSNAAQKVLAEAKTEAENLSRAKEQFLANMSHEIRTPMNAIVGFTEQILQMPLDSQPKNQLKIVQRSADHLLRLINDILDFSKLNAGRFSFEKIGFRPLDIINEACELHIPLAREKNLSCQLKIDIKYEEILLGDPYRLKQIILNLISNAIKFTDKGEIQLLASIESKSKSEKELNISIIDTGIGIRKEKLEEIFEQFTQAEVHTSRQYGGTGLGLAIVKRLVDLQNGSIEVNSEIEKGTTFRFRIPYTIGNKADIPVKIVRQVKDTSQLRKFKILVADDEEFNRQLIEFILKKWKVEHKIVVNGKQIIDQLKNDHFDLILMDVRMPVMDGIEATRHIRKKMKGSKSKIPIIALTATIIKEENQKCLNAGMNQVLLKPFDENHLLVHIMKVLDLDLDFESQPVEPKPEESSKSHLKKSGRNGISLEKLYHLAGNDEKFVREMLEMFIDTTNKGLNELNKAIDNKDWENVALLAHRVSSPCKHLDADNIALMLKQIENHARDSTNLAIISELIKVVNIETKKLISEVEEKLEEFV